MANKTIPDYTAAGTIDASSDELLLWQNSTNSYKKINRNTLLGVTGQPVDTSTAQSLTNKTIGVTNTVTLLDSLFTLQDNVDNTKQAQFQLSGITTATTRTYTLPNASSTIADISTAQTFTNKTLTSPVITGGSISNSSISVDSISEFTAANGVTVDGLNIKDGKLNTNNSVITANITDGAVTPNKLQSGTGTGWVWTSYTPTLTNLTLGNGTMSASYCIVGKTVIGRITITIGSTSSVGSGPMFTLPVTSSTSSVYPIGQCRFAGSGAGYYGIVSQTNNTTAEFDTLNVASTYPTVTGISSTIPFSWADTNAIRAEFFYEAA